MRAKIENTERGKTRFIRISFSVKEPGLLHDRHRDNPWIPANSLHLPGKITQCRGRGEGWPDLNLASWFSILILYYTRAKSKLQKNSYRRER